MVIRSRIACGTAMNAPPHPARPVRPVCARCERPQRSCLCAWITPTPNDVELLILQHPLEAHEAKGSARLLRLSLARCRCEVGEVFDRPRLAGWLGDSAGTAAAPVRSVLLYPADAGTPDAPRAPPTAAGLRLVLLDGTWRKTRRLLHANPLLQHLPRWALPAPPPSRYAIRRAQRPEQRSTLEAACLALGHLEGDPARYAPLLAAFEGWVAEQARWAAPGRRQR
jgi:DTW domain-containing protein YfiP